MQHATGKKNNKWKFNLKLIIQGTNIISKTARQFHVHSITNTGHKSCSNGVYTGTGVSALALQSQCEGLQGYENFFQLLLGGHISQFSVTIKLGRRLEDVEEEFRLINEMKIQENSNLAEMVLRSSTSETTSSTYNSSCLISPNIWWSRCPVDRIFQRS